jgi:glycerol kinase
MRYLLIQRRFCYGAPGLNVISQKCGLYTGIANQRETTIVWDRVSGEPLYPAIVWSDTRTKDTLQQIINRFA